MTDSARLADLFDDVPEVAAPGADGPDAHAVAREVVRRHRQGMDLLAGATDGGRPTFGAAVALALAEAERTALLRPVDRDRLDALFALLSTPPGRRARGDDAVEAVRAAVTVILDDPSSTLLALAAAGVALDSVEVGAAVDSEYSDGYNTGAADAAGIIFGGFAGPLGMMSSGLTASTIAEHLHVSVGWH